MSGINHLSEIFDKRGKEFTKKLFNTYVTINEKMEASCFQFEKSLTGEIVFYKRNSESPINLIDRTLMKYYEQPIEYINSLDDSVKKKLALGWRFGLEYFANTSPQEISYDKLPKNNLILSYINIKNSSGQTIRTIQDKNELDKWADLLQVERAPIIFQGKLTDDQKVKIIDYLETPFNDLLKIFKTQSFVKYIVSILNPKLKKTALNNSLDKSIEGLVFRFGEEGQDDITLAKLVDPIFTQVQKDKSREKIVRQEAPGDIYSLTVLDMMRYIESKNLNRYKPKGKTFEERYLNFVMTVFNDFVKDQGSEYDNVDFDLPDFMKKKEFDINTQFITNPETLTNIESSETNKQLFKIMLASFRKKKKKSYGLFSKEVITQYNSTIDKITGHISQNLKESLILPSFTDFISLRSGADFVNPFEAVEPEIEVDPNEEDKDKLKFISKSVGNKKEEVYSEDEKNKGSKKVNMVVGRFQPFHSGHMKMVKELYSVNKLPCVIVCIHPGHNTSGKSPLTIPTQKLLLDGVVAGSEGKIIGYVIVNNAFIGTILKALRPDFEPVLWGCGEDRIEGFKKQLELNFKKNNELKIDSDFEIMKTTRFSSGTEVREKIAANDFKGFKELVPKSIASQWIVIKQDINKA